MRTLWSRLAGFFGRRHGDGELDDEVDFHLEMLAQEHARRGMNADEARAAARRAFGGVTQMKEAYREQRSLPMIETALHDARYGVRTLLRTPGFTSAALLTLALGIGANAAIFSVVNAVLLRPLPYPEPNRILQMVRRYPQGDATGQTGLRYLFFRDNMKSFESLAAWRNPTGFNLATRDTAEYVKAMPVSREFFPVFGVQPAYGQGFDAEQDRVGGPDVTVLGYAIWKRLFNGDPAVIGKSVTLGDRAYTIVGVMPDGFTTMSPADLYIPLRPATTGPGGGTNYSVAGRLRRELRPDQAAAEATAVFAAFRTAYPTAPGKQELSASFVPYQERQSQEVRPALLMMLGAVGLLLLIACANTASLLLARASGRGREIAVRAALGAGRTRLVRQLLTESVVLFLAGGGAGVLLAYWVVPALLALTPEGYTIHQAVRVDATVLLVMLGVSAVTGVLFGLAPALSLSRHDLVEAFKDDGTRTTASRRAGWLRQGLVVSEIALCMLLLVGAGLLVQTFVTMRAIDPGFDTHNLLVARMSLQGDRYATTAELNEFFDRALERMRRIPGVTSAAVVNAVPIDYGLNLNVNVLDGPEKIEHGLTDWRYASPNYFELMKIRIVSGRGFDDRDRGGAAPVTVVNEQFARKYLKGVNPIGHHIRVFDTDAAMEIVGVARDVREQGLVGSLPAMMYVPVGQANIAGIKASHTYFPMNWVVRANGTGPELRQQIGDAMRGLDPKQPFSSFTTMDEVKDQFVEDQRFQMTLLGGFGAIGLLLASAGIYGLIAYSVAQRTREFGIRMALGASRQRILAAVLRQGAVLAAIGIAIGIGLSAAATRLLQNFVYGVSTLDPLTFAVVAALLVAVATLACLVPALRAVRLNPVSALRE
jgi:predicted permease